MEGGPAHLFGRPGADDPYDAASRQLKIDGKVHLGSRTMTIPATRSDERARPTPWAAADPGGLPRRRRTTEGRTAPQRAAGTQ